MLTVARAAHPGIRFEEGRLSALPFDIASIGAAVCWYSVIHTAPADLDEVFAELHRVLVPDGPLLIGFQAGAGERVERTVGDDETTALLISYRHAPDDVADRLTTAGFRTHGRAVRERELPHETSPQAFLLAMKGAA
jgi:SAM-dependent methyltransferase